MMDNLDYHAIGARVREFRLRRGLSQEDLAGAVNVTASFIGQIERGEKIASLNTVSKLANALDTTMDYIALGVRNRCSQQSCELYRDLKKALDAYRSQ